MNKNLHRIIFNAARGCRMAVAETSRTCSKAASGATAAVITLALPGLLAALPSQAQIIADPSAPGNQRPVILNTANGLPQVNIQTPSAAGVSRNAYSQFDVQAQGAILNNSATNVQTQLGGWIAGNPMLAGGTARVILNEVNSSNPSYLKGYVEVAGSRAEVIIANPSGIQVNGGGFINASTVTLTTGTPVMNGGNLESYQVTGGRIQIEGLGLDTRTASTTQILARAAEVNAGLWANHLKLVLGANQVNAADPTGETTGSTPVPIVAKADEAKPRFALDVAALGGMYAGHIYLTGTEKGLGVNTQGSMQANSGDLVLQTNGWLSNQTTLQASGNISITTSGSSNSTLTGSAADSAGAVAAHGVANSGSIYAGGNLTLKAEGEVNNSGSAALLAAGGVASVHAGRIANSGTAAAGVQADGTIGKTGTLNLSAAEVDNSASGELVAVDTRITAANTFTNRGLVDGANTRIDAATLRNVGTGRIYGDTVSLSATSLSNEAETLAAPSGQSTKAAVIAARARLDIGAGTLTNGYADGQSALIYSGGDMVIGGSLDANRRATGSAQSISNAGGTIAAMGNLAASAARISNTNPDFAYDIISAGSKADREYIAASGQLYTQEQVAWLLYNNFGSAGGGGGYAYGGAQGRFLPVGHAYADTKYQPYYGSGNAFVAAHTSSSMDSEGNTTSTYVGDSFAYGAGDAIWSVFGVAPPAGGNPGARPYAYCNDFGCYNPTSSELAAWAAAAAPWMNLQAKLDTFRSSVNNSAITYVTFRELSRDVPQAIVTHSTPGKISAAGDLTLNASDSLLNEQSQIVAGGLLKVSAVAVNNQAKTINTSAARSGTQYTWDGNFDYGCGGKNCVRYSAYRPYSYSDAVPLSLSLNTASVSTSQGSGVNQGIIQIPAAAGSSSGSDGGNTVIRSADPGNGLNTAPGSSLFRPAAGSNASYLLETDPRFTQYKTWLGSDYMTAALGHDPATTQKRLGDGFYEQLLVREQVAQLTGRRFLADYSSDEQQYRALMNAGITYAQTYNLRPGVALSAEQMAMLTSDIVWLVEKEVTLPDGSTQKALVPQLYARVQEGDLTAGGALLGGADVQIDAASVLNSGSIQGRRVVSLNAQTVANLGGDIRAQNTGISTAGDINNIGGRIGAEQNLQLLAGGSINVASTSATTEGSGNGQASRTDLTRIAGLYVSGSGGTLVASAGQDLNLVAGVIQSAGSASLGAAGNISLQTVETNRIYQAGNANASVRDANHSEVGSQVSAGGHLTVSAGQDINARAADISANGNTALGAGNNIILAAGQQSASYDYASRSSTSGFLSSSTREERSTASSAQAIASQVSGANVAISAGNNLVSVGTQFQAGGNLSVEGGNTQAFYEAVNVEQRSTEIRSSSSLLGISLNQSSSTASSLQTTAVASRLTSTERIDIKVGNQATLQGAAVRAQDIAITSTDPTQPGELVLGSSINTTQTSRTESSETLGVWQAQSGQGSTVQTAKLTTLDGQVSLDAGLRVTVQTGSNAGGTAGSALAALSGTASLQNQIDLLSAQPGLAYLKDLQTNPQVNWEQIKLANEHWSYSQQGLTPAGAALLSIAIAVATNGMGAELLGSSTTAATATGSVTTTTLGGTTLATTTTTAATATAAATSFTTYSALGAAINAGLSSLAAQASVALVNNGGDIGRTLAQMGSEQSVKSILIAMGVGATDAYTGEWGTTRVQSSGNTMVTDWAQRAQGFGVNTLVKGMLTGASNAQEWATIAGAGAAGEAYRYWVGRSADIRPGLDRPGGPRFEPVIENSGLPRVPQVVVDGVVREGKNIGLNQPCTSLVAICHGTPISNALNTLPGFNAFATLHDTWGNWLDEKGKWNALTNIGSMPPALLINYGSLLDNFYYTNTNASKK
jgi:filamentous hemagglutinin